MSYPFQKWIRYKNKEQNASFDNMSPLASLRTLAWQHIPVLLFLQLAILASSEIKDIVLTGQCQDSHVHMTRSLATEHMLVVSWGWGRARVMTTTGNNFAQGRWCHPLFCWHLCLPQFLLCNMGEPEVKLCFFLEKSGRFCLWPRDHKPYCCHFM